jgi:hypothetical protein
MVTDPDTAGPVRIEAHSGAEGGRGLQVVESCSVRWGWQLLDARAPDARVPGARVADARVPDARALDGRTGPGRAGKVVWALLGSARLRRISCG